MPVPGEIYQLAQSFELTDTGDLLYNIFDFVVTSGSCTDSELTTAIATAINTMYTYLLADIHSNVTPDKGIINEMLWSGAEWVTKRYVATMFPSLTFAGGGEQLPSATSALIGFLTTVPRVTGKKYLPPFTELAQNSSVVLGGALGHMLDAALSLIGAKAAGGATFAYAIRNGDGNITFPYGCFADGIISSQRRRKPGVGV